MVSEASGSTGTLWPGNRHTTARNTNPMVAFIKTERAPHLRPQDTINGAVTGVFNEPMFNEPMDPNTTSAASFTLRQGTIAIAGRVTYAGTTATFGPLINLTPNTLIYRTITTAAEDLAGTRWQLILCGALPPVRRPQANRRFARLPPVIRFWPSTTCGPSRRLPVNWRVHRRSLRGPEEIKPPCGSRRFQTKHSSGAPRRYISLMDRADGPNSACLSRITHHVH